MLNSHLSTIFFLVDFLLCSKLKFQIFTLVYIFKFINSVKFMSSRITSALFRKIPISAWKNLQTIRIYFLNVSVKGKKIFYSSKDFLKLVKIIFICLEEPYQRKWFQLNLKLKVVREHLNIFQSLERHDPPRIY